MDWNIFLITISSSRIGVTLFDGQPQGFYMLPLADQGRLRINSDSEMPTYILTTYRYYPSKEVTKGTVYYSIKVGDAAILTIYKLPKK